MDDVIVERKAAYSQIIIISYKLAGVGVSWVIAQSQEGVRGRRRVTREGRASGRRWCESWLRLGERTLSRYDVALICSEQVSAAAPAPGWVARSFLGGTEEDTAPEDGPADGIANLHAS